jgi:hypothetical protein
MWRASRIVTLAMSEALAAACAGQTRKRLCVSIALCSQSRRARPGLALSNELLAETS